MKKPLFQLTKLSLLLGTLFLISCATHSNIPHNHRTVADNDTLRLRSGGTRFAVPGSIFNAVDPRYIADRNGFSTRVFDGESRKEFGLNTFNDLYAEHVIREIDKYIFNIEIFSIRHLGVVWRWNYFINDHQLQFNTRALVPVLMPRAMERVTFAPPPDDSVNFVPNYMLRSPPDRETGRVRIYTRPIPYNASDENTLYLLDGVVITPRIFEAIKPIYIRSLERITNDDELKNFDQAGLQEVVKIETFSHRELGLTMLYNAARSLLLVDGIELHITIRGKLKSDFFKEHRSYFYADDNTPEYLRQQFPDKRHFTIITL